MKFDELLDKIRMPIIVKNRLQEIESSTRTIKWDRIYKTIYNWKDDEEILKYLNSLMEEITDEKLLFFHMKLAQEAWVMYQKMGIDENVFIDTMSYFSRTVREGKVETGDYCYRVHQWGIRQLTLREFRLETFEFELINDRKVVSIHIPSDVDLSREARLISYNKAKKFFLTYFPEVVGFQFYCYSWIISPNLKKILDEDSKIVSFMNDFNDLKIDYTVEAYRKWVYNDSLDKIEDLPEKTSLQQNLKKYLLAGNLLGVGYGYLKK